MPFPNPNTQFPKGRSGNPGGRPKTKVLTDRLRKLLGEKLSKDAKWQEPQTVADQVVLAWLQSALEGNPQNLKQMLDRLEGPVVAEPEETGQTTVKVVLGGKPDRDHDSGGVEAAT